MSLGFNKRLAAIFLFLNTATLVLEVPYLLMASVNCFFFHYEVRYINMAQMLPCCVFGVQLHIAGRSGIQQYHCDWVLSPALPVSVDNHVCCTFVTSGVTDVTAGVLRCRCWVWTVSG